MPALQKRVEGIGHLKIKKRKLHSLCSVSESEEDSVIDKFGRKQRFVSAEAV